MKNIKNYSVFIASPGDLAPERKIFRNTLDELNDEALHEGIQFEAVGWEDQNAISGRRVQSELNKLITDCDVFILALGNRWGEKDPEVSYSSNTEEEYRIAMQLSREHGAPEVFVFFKSFDELYERDAGPELSKVLAFRKELQRTKQTLYKTFRSESEFSHLVRSHVRAFSRGEQESPNEASSQSPITLDHSVAATLDDAERQTSVLVKKAEAAKSVAELQQKGPASLEQTKADLSLVTAYMRDLALARAAVDSANRGDLDQARLLFAEATKTTTELPILAAAADFFQQTGDLDTATRLVQRQTAIAEDRSIAADYYLKLVPIDILLGSVDELVEQALPVMLGPDFQDLPEESRRYWMAEFRDAFHEMFNRDHFKNALRESLVQVYTAEELLGQAAFLASPVGQSAFRKQKYLMPPLSLYGQQEFPKILAQRHPELFAQQESAPLPPPSQESLLAADNPNETA